MSCNLTWIVADSDAETSLRLRPLREHWEARGPGLLGHLRSTLPWLRWPDEVTVQMITPRMGGGGRTVSPVAIEFEAVLANPLPMLPEVVRMGWLIGSLGCPTSERVGLIPPVILAAEYVELARLDQMTVECAVNHWGEFDVSVEQLCEWWESVRQEVDTLDGWRAAVDQF